MIELFSRFVNERAIHAEALYILGDFFEYWLGDDDSADELKSVFEAFDILHKHAVPVYIMHGNRDFLISSGFEKKTHTQLIPDPFNININHTDITLMHGDSLCTDDSLYQEFKKLVRTNEWQQEFLSKSLNERRAMVENLRKTSKTETAQKKESIMDVNKDAVLASFDHFKNRYLIHGHTHRPAIHQYKADDHTLTRIVLGDWHDHGSVLSVRSQQASDGFDFELESFH